MHVVFQNYFFVFAFPIRLCLHISCELFGDPSVVLFVTKDIGHPKPFWKCKQAFGVPTEELVTSVPFHPTRNEGSTNGYRIVLVADRSNADEFFFGREFAMNNGTSCVRYEERQVGPLDYRLPRRVIFWLIR